MGDGPGTIAEHHVDSWEAFLEVFEKAREAFGRRPWFRGHLDHDWGLLPSIYREIRWRNCGRQYESLVAWSFISGAESRHTTCPDKGEPFHWLTLMRHYGLPTRLLDWTRSLLVAAYFAVDGWDGKQVRGPAIWALDPYRLSFIGEVGVPLSPYSEQVIRNANDALYASTSTAATVAVIPTETDLRMLVQQSVFTIHGGNKALEEHPEAADYLVKFPLDPGFAAKLSVALSNLHVDQAFLFPDLENLSEGIVASTDAPCTSKKK